MKKRRFKKLIKKLNDGRRVSHREIGQVTATALLSHAVDQMADLHKKTMKAIVDSVRIDGPLDGNVKSGIGAMMELKK